MIAEERFLWSPGDFQLLESRTAGGEGSGNFGHGGRPGEVGGSATWREYTDSNPNADFVGNATSRSDLPLEQHHAVHDYVIHNSDAINGALRAGTTFYDRPRYKKGPGRIHIPQTSIDALDAATKTDEAASDLKTYRAVDAGTFPETIGMVFSDKGFVSTSTDPEKAENIIHMFGKHPDSAITWEIDVPKGARFLDVTKHFDPDTDTHDESELLFGRNTSFEVVGSGRLRLKI